MLALWIDKKSVIAKFLFSSIGILLGFAANNFVANVIGPEAYGQYGFIIAAATFITQIVMVTLNETYIFNLSVNRHAVNEINTAYIALIAIVFILSTVIFFGSIYSETVKKIIWPDISNHNYLILGLVYILFLTFQQGIVMYGDCTHHVIIIEKLRLLSKVTTLLGIAILWSFGNLNLMTYFYMLLVSLTIFFGLFIYSYNYPLGINSIDTFKSVLKKMYDGWSPISVYPIMASLYSYGGVYALQKSTGGVQQGIYTYAMFIAMIPIAAITPMTAMYMSNMSKLYSESINLVKEKFMLAIKIMIIFYGLFNYFLATASSDVIHMLSGAQYDASSEPLKWLSAYSFLTMFGLLGGNLYFCTDRTGSYRSITTICHLIGIIIFIISYIRYDVTALVLSIVVFITYGIKILSLMVGNIKYLKVKIGDLYQSIFLPGLLTLSIGYLINTFESSIFAKLFTYGLAAMICCITILYGKSIFTTMSKGEA